MSEEIVICLDSLNQDEHEIVLWDLQREHYVEEDYLRGRVIEYVRYDDENNITLVLKELP